MAVSLQTEKNKRKAIKGQLTRFQTFLNSIKDQESPNLDELQNRLIRADKLLDDFNDIQINIENLDPDCDVNYVESHEPEREEFEKQYHSTIALARSFLNSKLPKTNLNNDNISVSGSSVHNNDNLLGSIKLPSLNLPSFDGSLDQWLFFRDTFISIIHNSEIADVQKFHYLRLSLKGDAAETIKSLQVSDANYSVAWSLLEERFENKQLLINFHMKSLFNLTPLQKETHQGLRLLLDGLQKHLRALEVLERPTKYWDDLIIYLIIDKFDSGTRRSWESKNNGTSIPTLENLTDFLKEKCRILQTLDSVNKNHDKGSSQVQQYKNYKSEFKTQNKTRSLLTISHKKCPMCNNEHTIYSCESYKKLSAFERLNNAKRLRLCVNCLGDDHATKDCRSPGCRKCGKIHHTLLHFYSNQNTVNNNAASNISQTSTQVDSNTSSNTTHDISDFTTSNHSSLSVQSSLKPQILLSTAVVKILDKFGNSHDCRVLLDSGSQSNFISQRLCDILQLPKSKTNISIFGISQINEHVNHSVSVEIKSSINDFKRKLTCLVLPNITGNTPSFAFDPQVLNIPKNITLADKGFFKSSSIDLLIGADTFWDLLCIGQIKLGNNCPILHKTKLGWIISGPLSIPKSSVDTQHCYFSSELDIDGKLTKFWEMEEYPKTKFISEEDAYCENHFTENTFQNSDGRFVVKMPLKKSVSCLGESKYTAIKRFTSLEKRLERNPDIKQQYHDFINEYIELGHMSIAPDQNNSGFFLPHHCVIKENSITTKLRVVFNGSSPSSSGYSVNDLMLPGPTIQDPLFNILIRFRTHNIVLGADIAKMYRQVLIDESQRNLQKILWRSDPDEKILDYTLNTVTYGLVSSSFLAIRALHEVAYQNIDESPKIASIILRDFYVDDLLTGGQTSEEVKHIKSELSSLLDTYGFPLRKWKSNDKSIIHSNLDSNILQIGAEEEHKTLGLVWNSSNDSLEYTITSLDHSRKITKRQILSAIAQIFDPLGLLSPVTIVSKIIIQKLWKLKLSWDESIPVDLHTTWSKYKTQLSLLNTLKIPRHSLCSNPVSTELHGFSDASESAFGASIYVRCVDTLGNITSNLLCAKTRVAPIKLVTIPRLELSGALLLSELVDKVKTSINLNFENTYYWSDSTIVLAWIRTPPHSLKIFVANRVSQIQNLTDLNNWRYVNTLDNPADLLSRGIDPETLINSKKWFHGPSWLISPENEWPKQTVQTEYSELPELRTDNTCLFAISQDFDIICKYSNLLKLQRVFAYVLRFRNNILKRKEHRVTGELSTQELNDSLYHLIRIVQCQAFPSEYESLSNSKPINKKSKLISLCPFFDTSVKIIRVGGRLTNSKFDFNKKYPAILPANNHLSTLITRHEHLRLLHAGSQSLLASLRDRFWPLSGRNLVRKVVHDCISCFKLNAKSEKHIMGNLPASRVTPARPFSICGVDYAGPFLLRDRKGKNFKLTKAYISLFVCFASKAMHLEVVSDLTSDCFLAALRRFMSRRGKCVKIFSDNGSTFVGANNEIKNFFTKNNSAIIKNLSSDGIQWNFITPRAPHQGGLWEAGVKSVKYHLKRVMGDASLTFEDFTTLLYQIEACLNSRPLYPLSEDPYDTTPLTPAHFIIGEPLTSIPDHDYTEVKENRLSRYERLQQLLQHFWARWSKEYVSTLQQRVKWKENYEQHLKPGTLVLVKEDNLPPLKWKLGRIVELHPGSDGITRSVTIKNSSGTFKRPVVKMCILPNQTDT